MTSMDWNFGVRTTLARNFRLSWILLYRCKKDVWHRWGTFWLD